MKSINEMSTKELVAEYNELTGKSITKFSSRAAGEKQVLKLRESASEKEADKDRTDIYGLEIHNTINCPHCNIDLGNGVGQHGDEVNGRKIKLEKHEFFCLGCGEEFGPELKAKSVNRSKGISESWNDAEIAAKRKQRDSVDVDGVEYRSVAQAFLKLNLPISKHIPFRMEVKAKGFAIFEFAGKKYIFSLKG